MVKKRTVNFKIASNRPELLNTRIQKVDNHLREVQFFNRSDYLVAKGVIERQVKYIDHSGRNRKTDDLFQFEMLVGEATEESSSLFNAVLKQNYFIFQPRGFGENQAILEQGFTLMVVKDEPFFQKQTVDIPVRAIIARGKENVIINFPVRFPENGIEPKYFQGSIFFQNNHHPPMVHGEIRGFINYRSSKNMLCEMEFTQDISILTDIPALKNGEDILIEGKISDFAWKRPPNGQNWLLELKLEYIWRFIKDKIVKCVLDDAPGQKTAYRIKTPVLSKKITLEIPKIFSVPADGLQISGVKANILEHHEKLTSKGILAQILILFEIYTINNNGLETHREYKVEHEELITGINNGTGRVNTEVVAKTAGSYISNSLVNIDLIFEFQINIYHDELVEITASEKAPSELILAEVFVEPKTFSLFGDSILLLKRRPARIIKLKADVRESNSETKKGWISISCRLELAVSYLDEDQYFREDVFMIPCRESFLWDRIDLSDRVDLRLRLDYESYTSNGLNVFYKYIVTFFAELFQTKEIEVAVMEAPERIPVCHETYTRAGPCAPTGKLYPAVDNYLMQIPIEGEVFLKLGKPKEIGYAGFFLAGFQCRRFCDSLFLEGKINSEVEYWDHTGYLRRETGSFIFSRQLRNNFNFLPELDNLQPVIHEYSYCMNLPGKNLKVIVQLELIQKRRG